MPRASGRMVKYHYRDHDTDVVNEAPPVQNTWYEVFHAQDVRLLWCIIRQKNDDVVAKDVEMRWTVDGTIYTRGWSLADGTYIYCYRSYRETAVAFWLAALDEIVNAAHYVDKRGLDFKVEVRMTAVPGTNQELQCFCVRETLVET